MTLKYLTCGALAVALVSGCSIDAVGIKGGSLAPSGQATRDRDRLNPARAALAEGRAEDSIRLYEAFLAAPKTNDASRVDALYGLALARLAAKGKAHSTEKARQALSQLIKESPHSQRAAEATALLAVMDELRRERGQVASLKKSLAAREQALEAARSDLQTKEEALENLRKALLKH
jgi:hypothetical protein